MDSRKKILFSLIVSVVLIIIVGFFRPIPLVSEFQSKCFWLNKFENKTKYDVVIYGDSRTYRGVSPIEVIGGNDLTGFNFGFTSAGFTIQMFEFLESRLDTSSHPIIVLGITPYSLTPNGLENKFFSQEKNRKKYDKFQKKYIDKNLTFFDRIVIEEILKPQNISVIQRLSNDGWVSSSRILVDTLSGLDSYENLFIENKVSQEAITNLLIQVRKWTDRGIEVYGFRPPTIISMEELENEKSGFNEGEISTEFESNGGIWLRFSSHNYKSYDGSHLKSKSAIKLSQDLNRQIFKSE